MPHRTIKSATRSERAELRRAKILDTARSLVSQNGFHATGVAQIAAAAGVHIVQLYRDFPSKEAIIAAIAEQDIATVLADLVLIDGGPASILDQIDEWVGSVLERAGSSPEPRLFLEIIAEASRNPRIAEILRGVDARFRSAFLKAVVAYDKGRRSAEEQETVVEMLALTLFGFNARLVANPHMNVRSTALRLRAIITSEVAGQPIPTGEAASD